MSGLCLAFVSAAAVAQAQGSAEIETTISQEKLERLVAQIETLQARVDQMERTCLTLPNEVKVSSSLRPRTSRLELGRNQVTFLDREATFTSDKIRLSAKKIILTADEIILNGEIRSNSDVEQVIRGAKIGVN